MWKSGSGKECEYPNTFVGEINVGGHDDTGFFAHQDFDTRASGHHLYQLAPSMPLDILLKFLYRYYVFILLINAYFNLFFYARYYLGIHFKLDLTIFEVMVVLFLSCINFKFFLNFYSWICFLNTSYYSVS